MGKIIEIPFTSNLIEFIADRLINAAKKRGVNPSDFSQAAVVFPHHRPGLYLRRILAEKLGQPFFPPRIFSMNEFMDFLAEKVSPGLTLANSLDSSYLLFKAVKRIPDNPWQGEYSSFNQFLFWGLKLEKAVEELDIEMVTDKALKGINMGDLWGANVAESAGLLMNHLAEIRQVYHRLLEERRLTTRGRNYAVAAENIEKGHLAPFQSLYLAGLFAMTGAEKIVIRHLLKQPEVNLIRQNDGTRWTPFEDFGFRMADGRGPNSLEYEGEMVSDGRWTMESSSELETRRPPEPETESPRIFLYSAFNTHSEVVGLRDILTANSPSEIRHPQSVAIVLPEPESLIPLLSEVMTALPVDYNITMGYPAVRTPVYALLDLFMKLQETKRDSAYYLPDYLSLLMHPYLKNIRRDPIKSTHTRILIHSIEETLMKQGKMFLDLSEIENRDDIFEQAARMTAGKVTSQDFKDVLTRIHNIFIRKMDGVKTLAGLGNCFEEILIFLLRHSPAVYYPFSREFFDRFFGLLDKIKELLIKDEEFIETPTQNRGPKDLFDLFRHMAKEEDIPFKGIPLKGLQILGLLETRALNFDRVFLLSANEGVLSAVNSFDSLLPLPLKEALGMPPHYQTEEIYRYHFHHLISSAREVHIFYRKTEKETRSRFVEKLVWEEEKKNKEIGILKDNPIELKVSLRPSRPFEMAKSPEILDVLRRQTSFSASGLNSYLKCPAQFYFSRVLCLKEKEGMSDEFEAAGIGTMLHQVLARLYQPLAGRGILGEKEYTLLEASLPGVLEEVFLKTFGELRGEAYLLKEIALDRLKKYILAERTKFMGQISLVSTEKDLSCSLQLEDGKIVQLYGRLDRIDRLNEEDIIVDYKSGGINNYFFNVKALDKVLTSRQEMKEKIKSLQLPFYVLLYQRVYSIPANRINSRLVSLQKGDEELLFKTNKKPEKTNRQEFLEGYFLPTIKNLIEEILNPDIPFVSDDKSEGCLYCSFPAFCRKRG
ncbi:MAG: PD-(D/E)XK nuclease family protein [bacterium]